MDPILSVRNLQVTFSGLGNQSIATSDISFDVFPGEVLALVGESGSGKSVTALSLLSLLTRQAKATGTVRYRGQDLLSLSEKQLDAIRGKQISMIFQDIMNSLNPVLTIGKQLTEPMICHNGLSQAEARTRAVSLLEQTGIRDAQGIMKKYPHMLSGGMRQRVMIAMALSCDPELLIADEPTTALDVTIQLQIMQLLSSLQKARHMALLLITHDLGLVAENADRVLVLYAGQCVECGDVDTILTHPLHPYTRSLLRAVPGIHDARDQRLYNIPGTVPESYGAMTGCRFHDRCPYKAHCRDYEKNAGLLPVTDTHLTRCAYLLGGDCDA